MRRGSNPCCENCNQLSGNELAKNKICPLAFWECEGGVHCPVLSADDSDLKILIRRWRYLDASTRKAIQDLL